MTTSNIYAYEQAMLFIREKLPEEERLNQLEEECAELIHAIAKLRRAKSGKNPTPVSVEELQAKVTEELADVIVCITALDRRMFVQEAKVYKAARWAERLAEAKNGAKEDT